jgi:murein DD-endopeptidase MepM/ murein hydrolase activator NlpD
MKKFFIFYLFAVFAFGQNQYPKDFFRSPLDIPLQLSGNFGELRPNHFHSGFDFKTQKKEGFNVYAVANGYVSRIKVSAYGYGNALYITHKNGYVSVYGHLQRYDSTISNYVIKKQYELESFEVDLFPQKNEIMVTQGQLIALSGNTGGSEGPHLHFEIRDQKTEEIINPYYFGFDIEDTIAPSIEGISIYPIEQNSKINGSNHAKYYDVKKFSKNK